MPQQVAPVTNRMIIRPRRPEDDERALEIYHQHETVFTLTLEGWRFHFEGRVRPEGKYPEMLMGEIDGHIVGSAYLEPNVWTTEPGVFFAGVEVDQAHEGHGIGRQLWHHVEPRLIDRGATKVYAHVTEGNDRAARFAEGRGFGRTGRADRISRLTVADVNFEGYEGLEERLAGAGIEIRPMSELDQNDDGFMRELYDAVTDAVRDIPSSEEFRPTAYEIWRENFLKSPTSSADAYWVAMEQGHPVGLANFDLPAPGRAFNGLTGVARRARGKGVARALKMRSVKWASENGIEFIDTGNDAENTRMLAINIRLGYKPLPAREEWMKEVAEPAA